MTTHSTKIHAIHLRPTEGQRWVLQHMKDPMTLSPDASMERHQIIEALREKADYYREKRQYSHAVALEYFALWLDQ